MQLASFQMLAMAVLSDFWLAADAVITTSDGASLDSLWPGYGCAESSADHGSLMLIFVAFVRF